MDEAALLTKTFRAHATFPSRGVAGAIVHESSALTWTDSGPDTDAFNVVLGAHLPGERVVGAVEKVRTHFASVGRPFSWWSRRATNLRTSADGRQRPVSQAMTGSSRWLAGSPTSPRGVSGSRLDARAGRGRDLLRPCLADAPRHRRAPPVLRRPAGRGAVASVEVAVADGTLAVYNLSTRQFHRGAGIAGSLLTHVLRETAAGLGGSTAVLQAAPPAASLYGRLAFEEFGRITEFKLARNV